MTIKDQLNALKTAISAVTAMPAALTLATLPALDEYVLGGPSDSALLSLGFYLGVGTEAPDRQSFAPVVQLQLPGTAYDVGLSYFDILVAEIKKVSPSVIGCVALDTLSYTEFPPDENNATIFTVYLQYSADRDDCDNWP
jgi:hypothetical protein